MSAAERPRGSGRGAELQRRYQIRLAMLPPEPCPRLAEAAVPMTACGPGDREFRYRFGIELYMAGVRAAGPAAAWHPERR